MAASGPEHANHLCQWNVATVALSLAMQPHQKACSCNSSWEIYQARWARALRNQRVEGFLNRSERLSSQLWSCSCPNAGTEEPGSISPREQCETRGTRETLWRLKPSHKDLLHKYPVISDLQRYLTSRMQRPLRSWECMRGRIFQRYSFVSCVPSVRDCRFHQRDLAQKSCVETSYRELVEGASTEMPCAGRL